MTLRSAGIGLATLLAWQNQSAHAAADERGSLLDLTHDTIFVRGMDDVITYWNRGAEDLYGWTRDEAIGKVAYLLLQTIFPGCARRGLRRAAPQRALGRRLIHTKCDGRA